jgi:hypothetical protein
LFAFGAALPVDGMADETTREAMRTQIAQRTSRSS